MIIKNLAILGFCMLGIMALGAEQKSTETEKVTQPVFFKIKSGDKIVDLTKIIISPDADKEYEAALASEVARIINNLTGFTPDIISRKNISAEDLSGALVIGSQSYSNPEIAAELKKIKFGYGVKIINNGVIIAGTDPYYTNAGVYRFFERYGIKFFVKIKQKLDGGNVVKMTPFEKYPEKQMLVISDSYSEKPGFATLIENYTRGNPRATKEFKAGIYGEMWVHLADLMVPYSIYSLTHPEYYALLGNGKRLSFTGKTFSMGIHLCMSNQDVVTIAANNIINWIDQQPQAEYFDISVGDGPNWCTCEACKKLDGKGYKESDRLWTFNNQVAALVKVKYPDKKLVSLAYTPHSEAPPVNVKIADNLVVLFAPYCWGGARSQFHKLENPVNNTAYQNFLGWMKILKKEQMIGFEYLPTYFSPLYPSGSLRAAIAKIKLYQQYPQILGFDYCGIPSSSFNALYRYVITKLNWEPGLDENILIDDFINNYYGNAAPMIKQYFSLLEETIEKKPHYVRCENYAPGLLETGLASKLYPIFDQAEKLVGNNPIMLNRVLNEKLSVLFVDLTEYNPVNGRSLDESSFAKKLQEFLYIMVMIKNPEEQKIRNRQFLQVGHMGKIDEWLVNVSGLKVEDKDFYKSELIKQFIVAADPADFLKKHANIAKSSPHGSKIELGTNVINYTQKALENVSTAQAAPAAYIWGGNNAKMSNTFKVIALKNNETSNCVEFIDNPYNAILQIVGINENSSPDDKLTVTIGGKEIYQGKIPLDAKNWSVLRMPIPKSAIKVGFNSLKLHYTTGGNKRLLVRELKLLY